MHAHFREWMCKEVDQKGRLVRSNLLEGQEIDGAVGRIDKTEQQRKYRQPTSSCLVDSLYALQFVHIAGSHAQYCVQTKRV